MIIVCIASLPHTKLDQSRHVSLDVFFVSDVEFLRCFKNVKQAFVMNDPTRRQIEAAVMVRHVCIHSISSVYMHHSPISSCSIVFHPAFIPGYAEHLGHLRPPLATIVSGDYSDWFVEEYKRAILE